MFKRILLPLDGSALAEQALPYAIAQAQRFGAELVLVRVLEPLRGTSGVSPAVIEPVRRRLDAVAHEYLENVAANVQEQGIPVRVVITQGPPHQEIVRFAEADQVDLIVMCTRGRSGFTQWLMGSVADRVVRGTSVAVLLVRPTKAET